MTEELPPGRINIRLNWRSEPAGSHRELPLKLLCVGSFAPTTTLLSQRIRYRFNRRELNEVMRTLNPTLSLQIPKEESLVKLSFHALVDFSPDALAMQIPSCRHWLGMRHLLQDLRARCADDPRLRYQINEMLCASAKDPEGRNEDSRDV